MDLLIKLLINAIAVFAFGALLKGVHVKSFGTAVIVAIVLALVNAIVYPIAAFFAIPFIVLTLGLFLLVLNALMVMLVDWMIDGLKIDTFWWALLFSVLMSIVNVIFF
jgi:putative membrane protein